ncbi:MAG: flagellin [Bradymonadia bacterium]
MGLFVNTNSSSLNAQRNLNANSRTLARSFARLSSGLRINSAKDDAAGLAISDRMTSQINGISQAIRNTNDGMSLAQTAEGGLQETTNILQRMRELAVQAANDTNTGDDRQSIQDEMTQLNGELDRIAEKTTFNNQTILDGSFAGAKFHVGANANDTLTVNVKDARSGSLGRMARVKVSTVGSAAIGGDTATGFSLKSSDNTFYVVRQTAATDDSLSTASNETSAIAKAAAINDSSKFHGVTAQVTATELDMGAIAADDFDAAANLVINGETITGISIQNDDADGTLVDTINAVTDQTGVVATIDEDNHLLLTAEDGRNIEIVNTGAPGGLGAAGTTVTRGGLILQADENIVVGDGNRAATPTVAAANQEQIIGLSATTIGKNTDFAVNTIDVTNRSGANQAIDVLDVALKQVAESRSGLGAVQNRMESTIRNLEVASENLSASRSRILDADFAQETAAFSRNQIMQQAGISVLAQANQQPQIALALLS